MFAYADYSSSLFRFNLPFFFLFYYFFFCSEIAKEISTHPHENRYFIFTLCPFVVNVSRLIIFRRERKKLCNGQLKQKMQQIYIYKYRRKVVFQHEKK